MATGNPNHFVRVSSLGQIGRFAAVAPIHVPRGGRVVCRTRRGLEVGEVVAHDRRSDDQSPVDGTLLRPMSPQDELLLQRLERNREAAFAKCQRLVRERQMSAILVDVELLFDGEAIYFYFLGELPASDSQIVEQLAELHEAEVRIGDFAKAMEVGCGPNCGTDQAAGCGDACSTCAVIAACKG